MHASPASLDANEWADDYLFSRSINSTPIDLLAGKLIPSLTMEPLFQSSSAQSKLHLEPSDLLYLQFYPPRFGPPALYLIVLL